MINKERLEHAISIMQRAGSVDMTTWQGATFDTCRTETELHTCGNSACFAGWLAVSPEFQETGGKVGYIGKPVYNGKYGVSAVISWFEATDIHEKVLELLVVGESFNIPEVIKEWFGNIGYQLFTYKVANRTCVVYWNNWEAKQVVDVLTNLLELEN